MKILSGYKSISADKIEADATLKGAVERYLYLVVQSTIDLAEAVISFNDFRKPLTYRESFDILCEEKVITPALNKKMLAMTGFRNIIAHDYETVDFGITYDVLIEGVKDIEDFVKAVKIKFI